MSYVSEAVWQDHFWTIVSVASGLLVVVSSFADRRRHRRSNIDKVGVMPWTTITVLSVLSTVVTAALAIKGL
jgi:hypothetical protein